MSCAQSIQTIVKFNEMPETEEKKEICRKYLEDEIGNYTFYSLAYSYLNSHKEGVGDARL